MERLPFNKIIAGVDEAGRGPLAGPVVAAAVIIPDDLSFEGLTDSKLVKEDQRDILYQQIISQCAHGIGIVDHIEIDQLNILQATFKAMKAALDGLSLQPELILIDGNHTNPLIKDIPQLAIVKGDQKEPAISAASILAKVTRDRLMQDYHLQYPQYNYCKHKGYPTVEHKALIKKHGVSPIQRMSFKYV
jgi:ribonuclease HII